MTLAPDISIHSDLLVLEGTGASPQKVRKIWKMSSGNFKAAQQPGQVGIPKRQAMQLRLYARLLLLNIYFWTSCCV